jgi:hypothetical protein
MLAFKAAVQAKFGRPQARRWAKKSLKKTLVTKSFRMSNNHVLRARAPSIGFMASGH